MKSWNHLYEAMLAEETRRTAVHKVCLGRKKIKRLQKYASDENKTADKAIEWIEHYKNANHTPIQIYDGITRKKRTIIVPTFKELTVQHCAVIALKPMFMHGMYEHSYASIPGRGAHKAKKAIEKWIRNDTKNVKYVLKMDIRHFFESIPHDILKRKLAEHIHDEKMLAILYEIVSISDKGLPLGFYTSQWLSNWYLEGLDHYIKEKLRAAHYVRYMDDMVVFGSNKRQLHEMRQKIEKYLNTMLGLKLKNNWQVFRFDYVRNGKHYGRDLDFMGFRFFHDRVALRRTIMLKATRKAKKISKKDKATIHDIRQMLSYLGWIDATNTYSMYQKRIKPMVNFQHFKRRISSYDKKGARNEYCLCAS